MKKSKWKGYAPVLAMASLAVVLGVLTLCGVIDLGTMPRLVADKPALAVLVALGLYALKGISASIAEGEMLSIVGTNGAGKSTFSKVLCGFEIPQKGTLTLSGEDLSAYSIKERADRIGYVMQNPNQMISKPGSSMRWPWVCGTGECRRRRSGPEWRRP